MAVALVCYLNRAGFYAYYRNETEAPTLERMLQYNMACIGQDGMIYHEFFRGYLDDGPALAKGEPPYGIQVIDCGCRTDVTGRCDYLCL